jgi:hypothetical protein
VPLQILLLWYSIFMLVPHNSSVHTLEARREQIANIVSDNTDAIILGSVGRSAILGYEVPTIKERRFARDIDVTTLFGNVNGFEQSTATSPFPLDFIFKGLINVSGDTAHVRFRADRPDISVELPSEIFEPYPVKIAGRELSTLHPDTLLNIHRVIGTYNPRVQANLTRFKQGLDSVPYARIAPSKFDPLDELQKMALRDPELRRQKLTEQVMALYDHFAPAYLRDVLSPLSQLVLKTIGIEARNGTIVTATTQV